MKLYKDYTKKPYSFLVNDATISSDSISDKIKVNNKIDNRIKPNKAQYNLDRQIAKNLVLSSGNVSKYELLTGKMFYQKKNC